MRASSASDLRSLPHQAIAQTPFHQTTPLPDHASLPRPWPGTAPSWVLPTDALYLWIIWLDICLEEAGVGGGIKQILQAEVRTVGLWGL